MAASIFSPETNRPTVERESFAAQQNRQASLVPCIEPIPQESFRLLAICCGRLFAYHFSFLVLVADLPGI
jgi:hypothetical protein